MTQPEYVPITEAARVRPVQRLPAPVPWWASRPGELRQVSSPAGREFGVPGPDQGYAMALVERFRARSLLTEGESWEDVAAGMSAVALRRAALFDRAPVVFDLEHALSLFGYLGSPPADLVAWRSRAVSGAAHDYWVRRALADSVPAETLGLPPAEVRNRLADWRSLLGVAEAATPAA